MAAPLWLPGATVVKAANNGGSMTGSDAYVTWHTFECDYTVSAVVGARALNANGDSVHLTFNPVTGEVAQMLPANVAGRGLLNEAGGVETNRQGRVNIQIEVIGRASRPWTKDLTAAGRKTLAGILTWLDQLGVPRTAPNGLVGPATYAASTKRARSVAAWNGPGGYFCHADVPENDHWDHGAIDMRDLWAVTSSDTSKEWDEMATQAEVTQAVIAALKTDGLVASPAASNPTVAVVTGIANAGAWALQARDRLAGLATQVSDLTALVQTLVNAKVDADAIATAVAAKLPAGAAIDTDALAKAVVQQLGATILGKA